MDAVKLNLILHLHEKRHGGFYMMDETEQMGEMVVRISGYNLTVYHTEVSPKAEGKGFARKLLIAMVEYSRLNL